MTPLTHPAQKKLLGGQQDQGRPPCSSTLCPSDLSRPLKSQKKSLCGWSVGVGGGENQK